MKNIIENIKVSIWTAVRNLSSVKLLFFNIKKPLSCRLGFHRMRRGFGWSDGKRMDICLKHGCNYSKWYSDKIGNKLLRIQVK